MITTVKLEERIQELEGIQQRVLEFEATPDPEYDIQDIEGEIPNEQKKLMKKYEEAKERTLAKLEEEKDKYLGS